MTVKEKVKRKRRVRKAPVVESVVPDTAPLPAPVIPENGDGNILAEINLERRAELYGIEPCLECECSGFMSAVEEFEGRVIAEVDARLNSSPEPAGVYPIDERSNVNDAPEREEKKRAPAGLFLLGAIVIISAVVVLVIVQYGG